MTNLSDPALSAYAVTPNDSADVSKATRAIYVGVAGDVKVDMADTGATITFKNAEGILPIRVERIYSTGTTATDIVGLY